MKLLQSEPSIRWTIFRSHPTLHEQVGVAHLFVNTRKFIIQAISDLPVDVPESSAGYASNLDHELCTMNCALCTLYDALLCTAYYV